jgi:DNA replication protein DnaD
VRNERDWNPQILLILIQNHAATLENNLADLQMIKHRVPLWPNNTVPKNTLKRTENTSPQKLYTVFLATLFMMVKRWQQSKCPPFEEWINKMRKSYTGTLFSHKKE